MKQKILLSADTPCDIGPILKERYGVSLFPLHILLDGRQYTDGLDISTAAIYDAWRQRRVLPKTAAINPEEYVSYFRPFIEDGYEIVHISLGSGISSCCQNCRIAAEQLGHVHVVDSCSLSAGFGLLVCEAGERIARGMPAAEVAKEVTALVPRTNASFILATLEFMHAGGRCSGFASFAATVMNLKPCIEVRTDRAGSMIVGKKYSGKLPRVFKKYVEDRLKGRDDIVLDRVFITHTNMDEGLAEMVRETVMQLQPFSEVFDTDASCTIGSHCGPNTLGVLFLTKA